MNDLVLAGVRGALASPEYGRMVERIEAAMPAIARNSAAFHKSHSQFMGVTVDVTALTPIRSLKGVLAEISRTRMALEEAYIRQRRNDLSLRGKRSAIQAAREPMVREALEIDIQEIGLQSANIADNVRGAIRKLSFFVAQHEALLARIGKTEITEADYEAEEVRYHIMTAMFQGLCAARSRGGLIDEGNHIYLFQLGIPPSEAQARVGELLVREQKLLEEKKVLPHAEVVAWLEALADHWTDCPRTFAEARGVELTDALSLAER